jgi:hypothetical protein
MIEYIFGIFTGLWLSVFVLFAEAIARTKTKKTLTDVIDEGAKQDLRKYSKTFERGEIFYPLDDADEARQKIIEENTRKGQPTRLEELQ